MAQFYLKTIKGTHAPEFDHFRVSRQGKSLILGIRLQSVRYSFRTNLTLHSMLSS
jgi:hypothetical protein